MKRDQKAFTEEKLKTNEGNQFEKLKFEPSSIPNVSLIE